MNICKRILCKAYGIQCHRLTYYCLDVLVKHTYNIS